MSRTVACFLIVWCLAAPAWAEELVILYTNDFHDHILAGDGGRGGLAYVSGYIQQVREESANVLVVDAGDVMEKGDMVAARTDGLVMYQAMERIGYDASVVGNHDALAYGRGIPQLVQNIADTQLPTVCVNLVDEGGDQIYPGSMVLERGGVRVGVVGMTATPGLTISLRNNRQILEMHEVKPRMQKEVARLRESCDVIIALCHVPSRTCRDLAQVVDADVFISAHDHEVIESPLVVEETGALIVQAGCNAEYVGRLNLEIEGGRVVGHDGWLVAMEHDRVPIDAPMQEWIEETERAVVPEAARILTVAEQDYRSDRLAHLYAAALLEETGGQLAIIHPMVIHSRLSAGPIDYNAVYRTGYPLTEEGRVYRVQLLGCEILRYLDNARFRVVLPMWEGMAIEMDYERPRGERVVHSDVDPDAVYDVIMVGAEWEAIRDAGGWGVVMRVDQPIDETKLLPCDDAGLDYWDGVRRWWSQLFGRSEKPKTRSVVRLDGDMTQWLARYLERRETIPELPPSSRAYVDD